MTFDAITPGSLALSALARLSRHCSPLSRAFPELTPAELSQALQVATAAARKVVTAKH